MENVITIAILIAIVSGIVWYMIRKKRRGETCTGCSCSGKCGGGCAGSCFTGKSKES